MAKKSNLPTVAPLPKREWFYVRPGKDIDKLLWELLRHRTPHGSEENIFHLFPKGFERDKYNNLIYQIGNNNTHKTMFSSHTDTVHHRPGEIDLAIDKDDFVCAFEKMEEAKGVPDRSVLGADDKLGVYMMLKMMEQKIPGLYVFHAGEECGGIGSNGLVSTTPELVKGIERCVAFDRRNYNDVITHQSGGQCCSLEFAVALSNGLNNIIKAQWSRFAPCDTGLFTDSANYTHLIPECTNLSVGYFEAHSRGEHFDLVFLEQMLLPALLKLDWSALPTKREAKPRYQPPKWRRQGSGGYDDHVWRPEGSQTQPAYVAPVKSQAERDADVGDEWYRQGGDTLPFGTNLGGNGGKLSKKERKEQEQKQFGQQGGTDKVLVEQLKALRNKPLSEEPPYDISMGIVPELSDMEMLTAIFRAIVYDGGMDTAKKVHLLLKINEGQRVKLRVRKHTMKIMDMNMQSATKEIERLRSRVTELQSTISSSAQMLLKLQAQIESKFSGLSKQ
jgi:hypothetical protein